MSRLMALSSIAYFPEPSVCISSPSSICSKHGLSSTDKRRENFAQFFVEDGSNCCFLYALETPRSPAYFQNVT